jgi:hypothetical protein
MVHTVMRSLTLLAIAALGCGGSTKHSAQAPPSNEHDPASMTTSPSRGLTCTDVCAREAECIQSTSSSLPFDKNECIAACDALSGDPQSVAKVEQHKACVMRTSSCDAVLECQ